MVSLFDHQKSFVQIAHERPRFAWFAQPGCGKTIGVLAACDGRRLKTVVIAPISVVESAWCVDAKHFPTLKVVPLFAESRHRVSTIMNGDWDILCLGPDMFKAHKKDLLAAGTRRLVMDESGKLKNPDSAITKAVIDFADTMEEVYLLSGTPAPNGAHEYWGQMRAMKATTLPAIKWLYKYFYPVKENIRVKGGKVRPVIREWRQSPAQSLELQASLRRCSWALAKSECLTLPPQLDRFIRVRLSPVEAEAYRRAEHELRLTLEDGSLSEIKAGAALVKIRQIVGGGVYADGVPQEIGTSKIDALSDLLDSIGPEPAVIWIEYKHERERVERLLVSRKETYGIIDGETSKDAGLAVAMFQDSKLQRLVCHPAAAGHGLTLHRASHAIFFSLNFSHDLHEQARGRVHRAGMRDVPATYTYLLADLPGEERDSHKTVDDAMLWTLKQKAKAADGMMMALKAAGVRDPAPTPA